MWSIRSHHFFSNQGAVWHTIQVALNVCIDHEIVSPVARYSYSFQSLRRASLRTEPIAAGLKVRLKDRLDHNLRRRLHHPIPYRRYPQWPLLPSAFGMYCRFTGCGQYRPAFRSACIPSRNCVTPRSSMDRSVAPSTPAAPLLLRTRVHAFHRTSLL
jgi:hypothetical protein